MGCNFDTMSGDQLRTFAEHSCTSPWPVVVVVDTVESGVGTCSVCSQDYHCCPYALLQDFVDVDFYSPLVMEPFQNFKQKYYKAQNHKYSSGFSSEVVNGSHNIEVRLSQIFA